MNAIPGYPLAAFLIATTDEGVAIPNPATLSTLLDADVILGREIATQQEYIILGREILQQVARAEDEAKGYNVLCIEIDGRQGTSALERLVALVQFVKGRHEFVDFRRECP